MAARIHKVAGELGLTKTKLLVAGIGLTEYDLGKGSISIVCVYVCVCWCVLVERIWSWLLGYTK